MSDAEANRKSPVWLLGAAVCPSMAAIARSCPYMHMKIILMAGFWFDDGLQLKGRDIRGVDFRDDAMGVSDTLKNPHAVADPPLQNIVDAATGSFTWVRRNASRDACGSDRELNR